MLLDKSTRLRQRIKEADLLVGVGTRDALEARLVEEAGFDFIWSSSFCISAAYAVPDASLLSMTQYLEQARAMNEAVGIPVVADCDTGYGNVANVLHALKRFEEAGAAAICIEDQTFPKESSLLPGGRQALAPADEFAGKVRALAENRRGDLVVMARTEALIAGWGMDEALSRGRRYVSAGADVVLVHSKAETPDEVVEFVRRWEGSAPLALVPTNYPSLTEPQVRALGKVKLLIYANQPLRAAVKAQQELLAEIRRSGGIHTIGDRVVSVKRVFELQGVPRTKEQEKKYMK